MKLTVKIKLLPTEDEKCSLIKTMECFNNACNFISDIAWKERRFGQINLHKLCYFKVREQFGLSAQLAVRAIGKVVESYRGNKTVRLKFGKHSALIYDPRILTFRLDRVSILSVDGRFKIPVVYGPYAQLHRRMVRGQADLILYKNNLFLCVCVEVPDGVPFTPKGALGVDFGIANIAATSDGTLFSGETVNGIHKKATRFKCKLQKRGTKNAKWHLKQYSGKERRFKRHTNHVISKHIVSEALKTQRAIALEDLKEFRPTVRRAQRETFGKWAFGELRRFIEYKAALVGVPVVIVDPKYTSQTCSFCGHVSKSNRRSQSLFSCTSCGETLNADHNAARNIGRLVAVNQLSSISVHAPILNRSSSGTESPGL